MAKPGDIARDQTNSLVRPASRTFRQVSPPSVDLKSPLPVVPANRVESVENVGDNSTTFTMFAVRPVDTFLHDSAPSSERKMPSEVAANMMGSSTKPGDSAKL